MIFSKTPSFKKEKQFKLIPQSSLLKQRLVFSSSTTGWRISGNYTSIFYWVQKFNFRCADFNSDHVKTNAFLLLFLIYLFCFKTGKIYYWASKTNLISHLEKEKKYEKSVYCNFKNGESIKRNINWWLITEYSNWWWNVIRGGLRIKKQMQTYLKYPEVGREKVKLMLGKFPTLYIKHTFILILL